jgi:pimeloyl-ACP methyl ester carboxylesterase
MNRTHLAAWTAAPILALSAVSVAVPAARAAVTCQDFLVPVTVPYSGSSMAGQLCQPPAWSSTVIVLVPGATYNQTYWNFPYDPAVYNFRQAMNNAGYATMTVDPLGNGNSSKPLSITLTTLVQAAAVHQVIQALRAGQVGGQRFSTVVLGGHSLGSTVVMWEAGGYQDVNGVLFTGLDHHLSVVNIAILLAAMYPADLEPRFAGLDPGYLTTGPGNRQGLFYVLATTDPKVVAADEATKDAFSTTEAPDGALVTLTTETRNINVPVLMAVGQDDQYMCGAGDDCSSAASLRASEAPYFTQAAHLQTYVLPGSGHDLNLATNTQQYQQTVITWLKAWFR